MKRRLKDLLILLFVVGIGAASVIVSGVIPIRASDGHLQLTKWLLDFSSDRSIAFHSAGIEVPPLDEPGFVTLGAGTFEANCAWCHGRPGWRRPRVASQMTPPPPDLADVVQRFESNELFYVLRHGIKFAGMPAWPADHRDAEVWPVVAFLHELPVLSPDDYLKLIEVAAPTDRNVPDVVASNCAHCHGIDGTSRAGDRVPLLAGQQNAYLQNSLNAFAEGSRHSGVMEPIAARLEDKQIAVAVDWYSSQSSLAVGETPRIEDSDGESLAAGRRIAHEGVPDRKVPSCIHCHGPGTTTVGVYPKLAGMPQEYLIEQLELFRNRDRGGTGNASVMHPAADALTEQLRRDVTAYYASLPPTGKTAVED